MLLSVSDYIIQAIIALLVLVYPWFLRPGHGLRAFGFPFLATCLWGIWRMFHFDPATRNDIPGFGYFVVAFLNSLIALLFFGTRCAVLRRKPKTQRGS